MKRCYIVGAGSIHLADLPVSLEKQDLLIAADGGWQHLQKAGQTPHLLVGDFDSSSRPETACETILLPVEKDDTDLVYAVKEGFARGYTQFVLYGGLGGERLSHTLANLQLLAYIKEQGGHGQLVCGKTRVFLLQNEQHCFPAEQAGYCSVFAYDPQATVSLQGLYYAVKDRELSHAFPLGVSNRFVGTAATVTAHKGRILVVLEDD